MSVWRPDCEFVVFLALYVVLAWGEFLLVQSFLLLVGALFAYHLKVELRLFGPVVQPVLLHAYLCVSQYVLLFSKLGFGIQNLQVEVAVAQTDYHIAFFHFRAFFLYNFSYDTSLFGAYLDCSDRHHAAIDSHIVVE